ncbi:MAG: N-6 DNA methylase [Phycisphaerales bacterium]
MSIELAQARKLRGGYYTPAAVAEWLARWAIRSDTDRILEPSCGDGTFLRAVAAELQSRSSLWAQPVAQVVGVELIPDEAAKALARVDGSLGPEQIEVVCADFFDWLESQPLGSFDAVVGNPPFIRYQNFPEPSRSQAISFMQSRGLRPNRLTNIWVPFVVAAVAMLRSGGRLAMVIPAELLQVTYAAQLRQHLADSFKRITVYACNEMFFERAEQEVVLLLADDRLPKSDPQNCCDVTLVEAGTLAELLATSPRRSGSRNKPKLVQHDTEKWLKYFLDAKEISLMRDLRLNEGVASLSEHATVDVGVVTGKNEFFVVSESEIQEYDLASFVIPLVGRSSQLPGTVHRLVEHRALGRDGKRVFLLHLVGHNEDDFTDGLRQFIRLGESSGHHLGYKCSIRNPWYRVPSVWQPDCFFFRQIYDFPRVVVNKAKATSTDTIHRMRCSGSASRVAANLYTHLTAASAEIEGRSYGGGVLELEPTEAERLLVPRHLNGAMPIIDADKLVRDGRLAEVLDYNDKVVLQSSLGLSRSDCEKLKRIWAKMRDRRQSRRKR